MKWLSAPALVLFAAGMLCSAQSWPTASGNNSAAPSSPPLEKTSTDTLFLSGRVIVADGVALPQPAAIETSCEGHVHTAGFTDAKGYFMLQLSKTSTEFSQSGHLFTSSDPLPLCDLQADVPGFISEKVHLATNGASAGMLQVGNIMLHAASPAEGNMISATSAAAPSKAQKNFQKGCQEANRAKWNAAAERFQEAVHIYPKYAQAWLYLGKVQLQQEDPDQARQSFHEALAADSRFVDAYAELAQLALREKRWQELADDTDHILQLSPVGMPQFWYLNSAANFELKKVDKAEKSALQGLRDDIRQRIPQLQYLMGAILALKHDYRGAAEHIRHYLRLAPHAQDAAVAQQQLQQLEKMSGAAE